VFLLVAFFCISAPLLTLGENSGLGLGICCRVIDEFLSSSASEVETLTIIFTTRSARKGAETRSTLERRIAKWPSGDKRVVLEPENVELTDLLSVRALCRRLLERGRRLDAVVLNAGIGGWSGLDWPRALWTVLTRLRQATTWPTYKLGLVGLVTKPQMTQKSSSSAAAAAAAAAEEPLLGQVFCANTFGHYMMVHWLMPLLRACPADAPAKVVWTSSIECGASHYDPQDHQALKSAAAYEHTKRLADLMVLSAVDQPATARQVADYITPSATTATEQPLQSEPRFLLAHPGICTTTIISLYWILHEFYRLFIYISRWVGSPWANVTSYLGATSVTWLLLASSTEIEAAGAAATATDGRNPCKWGSACDRRGNTYARVTDVEGWGINGSGKPFVWWGGTLGRKTGAVDATPQDVENFVAQGAHAWNEMEVLRKEWESRIEGYEAEQNISNKS
jgi:3-keto steroid reductase